MKSFLGTGWSFPPAFDKESKTVAMVSEEEDIKQSLQILLSTSLGERVLQPEYGCNLNDYQFEAVDNTLIGFLSALVENAILNYEPRIILKKINITNPSDFDLLKGILKISVDYIIDGTNSRDNFVYDFYIQEATNS